VLKAVVFDLGNTLVKYYTSAQFPAVLREAMERCDRVFRAAGHSVPPFESVVARANEYRESADYAVKPLLDRLAACFDTPEQLDKELTDLLCSEFHAPIAATGILYEDSIPCLERVREMGLKVGILSNTPWGCPSSQWDKEIEYHGIKPFIDASVYCCDAGWRKPAVQPFEMILSRLEVLPSEAVMIGDSVPWDVEGAMRAGMRAVYLDRERSGDYHPSVNRLDELPELLASMMR